jgi:chromosome segregation ATPase
MPDGTSDAVDSVALEGAAAAWLESRAEELGIDEEELLHRIIATYREAEEADDVSVVTESTLEDRLDDIEADLADVESSLQADVEAAESEFADKIDDVRERVIQVKRETDEKAPTDHDHPELAERLETTAKTLRDVEAGQRDLTEEVEELDERVDAGFDNFEEVLSYLRDETDSLDRKTATLASAVLAMRESVASVAAAEAHRKRVEQLQREANLAGVTDADCGECGQSVTVAQLAAPECPFCGAVFEGVEPKSSWFGSHTLLTGSTPALEGGEDWLDEDEAGDSWLGDDGETLEEVAEIADEEDDTDA